MCGRNTSRLEYQIPETSSTTKQKLVGRKLAACSDSYFERVRMFNVCVTEAGLLPPYLWYCCKMVGMGPMGTTKNILTTKKLKYMQNVKKGAESALLPSTLRMFYR
jgi:hypothetical protein